ncbi:hypothetical protein NSP_17020 [Nodularia spumigena CCY9414]|nr:hypothetical protein NSP_17020 [Nodularia spumigena CCY9414]
MYSLIVALRQLERSHQYNFSSMRSGDRINPPLTHLPPKFSTL